ncbi:MAG: ClpX C4-type zinc finger protein [Rhodoplanes sp.]
MAPGRAARHSPAAAAALLVLPATGRRGRRLVAGASAYICDTCIVKCVAVLEAHGGSKPHASNH